MSTSNVAYTIQWIKRNEIKLKGICLDLIKLTVDNIDKIIN